MAAISAASSLPQGINAPSAPEPENGGDVEMDDGSGEYEDVPDVEPEAEPTKSPKEKRLIPDETAEQLYARWKGLLPKLVSPYLQYQRSMSGKEWTRPPSQLSARCRQPENCKRTTFTVTSLFFGSFHTCTIVACECQSLPIVLIAHGLFPTAPHSPRMAISVELLELFLAVSERSSDAVTALAVALNRSYRSRGFVVRNAKGEMIRQPFRRGLGYALRWYDCLRVEIERRKEAAISAKFERSRPLLAPTTLPSVSPTSQPSTTAQATSDIDNTQRPLDEPRPPCASQALPPQNPDPTHQPAPTSSPQPVDEPRTPGAGRAAPPHHPDPTHQPSLTSTSEPNVGPELVEAARILYARCPACFGLKVWGRPLTQGGDVHLAVDGNFNHRHVRNAANSPKFYDPTYVLPKEKVDAVGERIEGARKRVKKKEPAVPDTAIDACEESHESGTGSTVKTSMEKFDSGGLAAIVCRHDIPLFIANIDTPGEQQKYAVALLEQVIELLPRNATIVTLYDVGCVLDRSVTNYEIFPDSVSRRLLFATSIMHSYVHIWSCQLHYNPRMKNGLGLTDGENVERLWSALRRLIGVCRNSAANRRIWLIDRQVGSVAQERRGELGVWLRRKLTKGVADHRAEALASLKKCGVSEAFLREQWVLQKEEELSLRAHKPTKLKKELNQLMGIQDDIDALSKTVATTTAQIKNSILPKSCTQHLKVLQNRLDGIHENAQDMYVSLNVNEEFPSLTGVDLEFVRKIFLLRELKQAVQKRATSAFWEFDKLDRAAGGKDMVLGTKMHQHVRHAMSKKTSALENAVKRYNSEVKHLVSLRKSNCTIPIPEPLPTSIADLKTSTTLMEAVWVDPVDPETHRWVRDAKVRDGIRAMHKLDRCQEELHRLGREADNMLRWYKRELTAVVEAIRDPQNSDLIGLLEQDLEDLLALSKAWGTVLVDEQKYRACTREIMDGVSRVTLTWMGHELRDGGGQSSRTDGNAMEEVRNDDGKLVDVDDGGVTDAPNDLLFDEDDLECERDEEVEISPEDICLQDLAEEQANGDKLAVDTGLLRALTPPELPSSVSPTPRNLYNPVSKRLHAILATDELQRLSSPSGWLNDDCVNGLAVLLHQIYLDSDNKEYVSRFIVFSSLVFRKSRETVIRQCRHLPYWTRDIWILPINRPDEKHWVLAIILPLRRRIYLFDSFAHTKSWQRDIPDIISFVESLNHYAESQGHPPSTTSDPWIAEPVISRRLQKNTRDCGVWVLAAILSCLRGFHVPDMTEKEITVFRSVLYRLALHVPTVGLK
ncbi:hypothetical protein DFP72DRAFT_1018573 [Ephemerocybe angulata]|uniref:Ubiquitin-like protease family profile domain-containing protein n=1 Tax=Ephemerocybe angulata TaxID=980116 RepID=A0A8H6HE31_9AGAR|nr:hypothetical protein DFP72DRAFT_1018573 [Tulosesus angulatus]